jgi:hypothetical protein
VEELLPKDNENIPFLGPVEPSAPSGFSAAQMIRCDECLRANPPTRITCLYCVAPLPLTESSARLRRLVLRPPEKHQLGYNNILLPPEQAVSSDVLAEAASLLKLSSENLQEIVSRGLPLPVARTASREEAELVLQRLRDLGLQSLLLSDEDLGLSDNLLKRVRSMSFDNAHLTMQQAGAAEETTISWSDVLLVLPGRLFETRLEIKERKTRTSENEILDASEFFRDEAVIDFYASGHEATWRVNANGFDFSCLGSDKTLIATENISKLQRLMAAKAITFDDSYRQVRSLLELAWGMQSKTESSGWRRERPGKLSVGMATIKSNESQFTRYSRLRYHFNVVTQIK